MSLLVQHEASPSTFVNNHPMQVLISSSDDVTSEKLSKVLDSKGLTLTRFDTIKEAREALSKQNVLLIFCDNRLADGTYEDLLKAARAAGSRCRIVVTGLESDQFDALGYCKARELGAFDVLRKSYGRLDLAWVVICAIRDEEGLRNSASWQSPSSYQPHLERLAS